MAVKTYRYRQDAIQNLASMLPSAHTVVGTAGGLVIDIDFEETDIDDLTDEMTERGFTLLSTDPTTDPSDDLENPEDFIHLVLSTAATHFASLTDITWDLVDLQGGSGFTCSVPAALVTCNFDGNVSVDYVISCLDTGNNRIELEASITVAGTGAGVGTYPSVAQYAARNSTQSQGDVVQVSKQFPVADGDTIKVAALRDGATCTHRAYSSYLSIRRIP